MRLSTEQIAEEFVRSHIDGRPATLKQLALKHGRNYEALRKAAAKGKWSHQSVLAIAERGAAVGEKMRQQNALTASLLAQSAETEAQVRQRHAGLARSLQQAAIERLMAIRPDEVPLRLAVEMLKIGVEVERQALALGDVAPNLHDEADALRLREAVESAREILERHARAGDFGDAAKEAYGPLVEHSHVNGEELVSDCNQLQ